MSSGIILSSFLMSFVLSSNLSFCLFGLLSYLSFYLFVLFYLCPFLSLSFCIFVLFSFCPLTIPSSVYLNLSVSLLVFLYSYVNRLYNRKLVSYQCVFPCLWISIYCPSFSTYLPTYDVPHNVLLSNLLYSLFVLSSPQQNVFGPKERR